MKKLLFTLIVTSLATTGLFAQGFSGGLKGGLNLSNQDLDGLFDTKMKIGFHVGAFATYMFNEKMGIQPEILYSVQGSTIDEDGVEDATMNVNYLTIPVLFRYNVNEMIYLNAGPQFGFLMKAEVEVDGDTEDFDEYFSGTDIGGAVGLGADLPMGLGFGARYVFGLSNILDYEDASDEYTWKNSNIQIYASYRLFGGKK